MSVGNNGVESWVAVTTPHRAQRLLKDYPLHVQGKYNPQTQEYRNAVAGELLKNFISVISQFQVCLLGVHCRAESPSLSYINQLQLRLYLI